VALASYYIHKRFNDAHPEMAIFGNWLVRCLEMGSKYGPVAPDIVQQQLDVMHTSGHAPPKGRVRLLAQDIGGSTTPCVRVQCGPWPPTVCWRDPAVLPTGAV